MVCTNVVHVNGLGLTLHINPIMKFIYACYKRNYLIAIYVHVSVEHETCNYNCKSGKCILCHVKQCKCKCKNKYIYRILNVKKCKKCDFYLSRGDFVIFWWNGPLPKKNKK